MPPRPDPGYHGPVAWGQVPTIVVTVVLAVLTGTVYNNRRFDDVNLRFDDVNRRFDDVHCRIDDLRAGMNARFAEVNARLTQVETRLTELREDFREVRALLQEAIRARVGGGWVPATSSRKQHSRVSPGHAPGRVVLCGLTSGRAWGPASCAGAGNGTG